MALGKDTYLSDLGTFHREDKLVFELTFMNGESVASISNTDIEVTIFTSQLSPRKHVTSYVRPGEDASLQIPSDAGGSITRYSDHWVLELGPEILSDLDRGVLMLKILYIGDTYRTTSMIRTSKFI